MLNSESYPVNMETSAKGAVLAGMRARRVGGFKDAKGWRDCVPS